jgi:tetratricopeptide (TPR) repeat protein
LAKQVDARLGCGNEGKESRSRIVDLWVCCAVVGAIVLAAHCPGLSARALMLDDDQYLVENRLVQNPSWTSAKRFITEVSKPSTVRGYYQPLSMISLMLDCAMGAGVNNLKPFHRTSLALHIANSLLVIVFLYLLFGRPVPAAMVGLLYGVHPVTIESVAWISERKTVLAAFFALLCLVFYLHYVRRRSRLSGATYLLMYVLSVLSKPGIIGMPILLLLLDYWPLKRFGKKAVLEKLPLFVIAGVVAVVTFISQSRAASVTMPGQAGLVHVIFVFCHNIVFYLYNFIWPANLSWYYPFPKPFDLSQPMVLSGVIGTCVLIPVLLISLRWMRSVAVGWMFFFVAIFPTLGVIGIHPMIAADRHMYFPMVGLLLPVGYFFALFWGGEPGKRFGRAARQIILIIAVLLLTASEFILMRCYLVHWRDSESVYEYMLGFSPDVVILHNNLGNVLKNAGKVDQAVEHFNKSLELKPNSPEVHNNLGTLLDKLGRVNEAVEHYERALELRPNFSQAHYNLATLLAKQGKTDEAIAEFSKALGGRPDNIDILSNMAFALAQQGELSEAVGYYKKALAIEPDNVVVHGRLGLVFASLGRLDDAIREFRIVLNARPDDAEMHFNLGVLLEKQGRISDAIKHYRNALQINPNYTQAGQRLKAALAKQGKKN